MAHEISINNNNSQKLESKLCIIVFVTPNLKWEHILKHIVHVLLCVCACHSNIMLPRYFSMVQVHLFAFANHCSRREDILLFTVT